VLGITVHRTDKLYSGHLTGKSDDLGTNRDYMLFKTATKRHTANLSRSVAVVQRPQYLCCGKQDSSHHYSRFGGRTVHTESAS
jgi:hypothetical protein